MEAQNKTGKESKSLLRQQPGSKTKTHYTFSKEVAGYKLVLLDDLGGGGFAKTYKAQYYDRSSNPDVPTKVVVKEFFMDFCERVDDDVRPHEYRLSEFQHYLEKFKRESKILSTISHKNIVKVLKQFDTNNTSYYVMEFIDGLSFYKMIIKDGPVKLEEARNLLLGVIDALEYMHHQKEPVYHMDITPNNIMFGKSDTSDGNESKLIDFGLCKTPDKGSDQVQFSTDRPARTEYFACPELYNPSDKYGNLITILPAMDVYSLAATLYFMVTGYFPLSAISDLNKSFHWPKNADLRAVHVLYPSMQLDINKRTASIGDFRRLLNEAITLDLPTKFEGNKSKDNVPYLEYEKQLTMSTFTFPYGLEVSQLDDMLKQKCLRKKVIIKKTATAEEYKPENKEIIPGPDKEKLITGNSDEQGIQQPSQLFTGVAGDPPVSEEHTDIDGQNPKKAHHDRVVEKKPLVEGPAKGKSQPLPEKPVDIPVADKENDYNGNSWRARPKNSLLKEAERVKNNANNKIITIQVEKKNWINRLFDKFNALFSKTDFLENVALAICLCFVAVVGWYLSTVYDNNDTDSKAVEQPAVEQNIVNNVNNTFSAESIQTLFVDYHQGKIKEQDVLRMFTPNAYFLLTNGKDYIGMPDDPNHSINELLSGDYLTDQHYKVSEVVLNESAGLIETLILQK
jgi:serine/threonine protein kinase